MSTENPYDPEMRQIQASVSEKMTLTLKLRADIRTYRYTGSFGIRRYTCYAFEQWISVLEYNLLSQYFSDCPAIGYYWIKR